MSKVTKRIFNLIKEDRYRWVTLFVFDLCINIMAIINPLIISSIINMVTQKQALGRIMKMVLLMLTISLIGSCIIYKKMILRTKANNDLEHKLLVCFLNRFHNLSREEYIKIDSAYFSDRLILDNAIIVQFIVETLWRSIFIIISSIVYFILITRIDPRILFLFIIFIPIYILIYYCFKEKIYRSNYEFLERKNTNKSLFYNLINLAEFIRFQALQLYSLEAFDDDYEELKLSSLKLVDIISKKVTSIEILKSLFTGALLIFGAKAVLNGSIMVGTLFVIDSYFYSLLNNVDYIMNLAFEYQQTRTSINRMEQFFEMSVDIDGDMIINYVDKIQFKNLNISYDNLNILENFNQDFTTGNIYVIQGPNGSGKSTIINIITGIEKGYSGSYIINEIYDSRNIDFNHFRKFSLSICEQEIHFINDTILNNLLNNSVKIDKAYYYCKKFGIYEYILSLEDGFNTIISDETEIFSKGQRKKIGIIRSMLKPCDILIMDEPEANLDKSSTSFLYKELKENFHNKIVIIVSHLDNHYELTNNRISLANKSLEVI